MYSPPPIGGIGSVVGDIGTIDALDNRVGLIWSAGGPAGERLPTRGWHGPVSGSIRHAFIERLAP